MIASFALLIALFVSILAQIMRARNSILYFITIVGCWAGLLSQFYQYPVILLEDGAIIFVIIMTLLITVFLKDNCDHLDTSDDSVAMWSTMLIVSLIGLIWLIKSNDLISIFVTFELMSLPLIVMIMLNKSSALSQTTTWRYLILTTTGTTMWLLGLVLLYGLTGQINVDAISIAIERGAFPLIASQYAPAWILLIMFFISVGIVMKLGAVPLQRWVVDVFRHVPINSLIWLSTVPKVGVFAMAVKLLSVFTNYADFAFWLFMPAGLVSIGYGALMALAQKNIRDLLAYSSISQMGFVLVSLSMWSDDSWRAGGFVLFVYILVSFLVLGLISVLKIQRREIDSLYDLRGLGQSMPVVGVIILLAMFSMAAIPPWIGFYAKFAVLRSLMLQYFWYLATFIVVVSIVSAYYYLNVVKHVYFVTGSQHDRVDNLAIRVLIFVSFIIILLSLCPWFVMPVYDVLA